MVSRPGRHPTKICLIFIEMLSLVFNTHRHRHESLEQPLLSPENLSSYVDGIDVQVAPPLQNCCGFIDGTVRKIARPNKNKKKLCTMGIKGFMLWNMLCKELLCLMAWLPVFLVQTKGNGTIAPCFINLLPLLEQHAVHNGAPTLSLWRSCLSVHSQETFKDRQRAPGMELFNKSMKINLSGIGKIYIVSALLQNIHPFLYGNIVSEFFQLSTSTNFREIFFIKNI